MIVEAILITIGLLMILGSGFTILVSHPQSERRKLAENIVIVSLIPLVLGILLLFR